MKIKCEKVEFDGEKVILREEIIEGLEKDEIIVRAEWSQVSIGTEVASIKMAKKEKRKINLGYSLVGRVEEKGEYVQFKKGERVLVLAPHSSFVKVKATPVFTVKVIDGLASDIATVGILGSVAFHIIERANIKISENVGVLGQGVVGSLCMQLAKMSGATPVIAIDIDDKRLKIAKEYGADICINSEKENIEEIIFDITSGKMLNVIIETTGKAGPIDKAKNVLGKWGRMIFTSFTNEKVCFAIHNDIVDKEITIIGAHQPKCPVEDVPYYPFSQIKNRFLAMEFLRDGKLKIEKLISHRIKREEIPRIYSSLIKGDPSISGILIDWR